ncbi:phosphoribosyltransferase [Alkaliphilus metalliredigens QYMF]|uniref:Phosphoribosyltransferase n=1 Tax=Alkaliphilus metalliredigens (strain QYMF) TaxID=293826 RepID=A6TL80_ALKMQ|nr:ComF family protein [Alkaliphilus metalliredigens]ABR46948.1 phosphoribosyltransferase [Alkaliphilus metalliredigens QYMF]
MKAYWGALMDLMYPLDVSCIACKENLSNQTKYYLCDTCYGEIDFFPEHCCHQCGKILSMTEAVGLCQACESKPPSFERAIAVFQYQGHIKRLIFRFKYEHEPYLSRIMGQMLADSYEKEALEVGLIIPVPLHYKRQKQRGFNQAELLAKYMSQQVKQPYDPDVLIRSQETIIMHHLTRQQREENVKQAFMVKNPGLIVNQKLLLIDDIVTTGATLKACSRVLLEAGAQSVTALTLARGGGQS